jgi:spermidine synthase
VILYSNTGIPTSAELSQNAAMVDEKLNPYGINKEWVLSSLSRKKDWNAQARVFTDQFSPVNLINR